MSRSVSRVPTVRHVTQAIGDSTGRSHDEVVAVAAAAATLAVSVVAWRGIAWAVDAVTGVDLWPSLPGGTRG